MADLDFKKLFSDEHVAVWIGPNGAATGIANVATPTAAAINNTGGTSGMIMASPSISWNSTELVGVESSEEVNEPSLADAASYVEFGPTNLSGTISYFMPREYDDNSNNHSVIFDLTRKMRTTLDFVNRIDGAKKTSVAAANGDYVSVTRAMGMSEEKAHTISESITRDVSYTGKGDFAHYTVVGPHTLTATKPAGNPAKGRITVRVGGRDYTNACRFSTSDPSKVVVYAGGAYEVRKAGAATVTVTDEGAGTSTTVSFT